MEPFKRNLNSDSHGYTILSTLQTLVEMDSKQSDETTDIAEYKRNTKKLLSNLLLKLEENVEYQTLLEEEVKRSDAKVRHCMKGAESCSNIHIRN